MMHPVVESICLRCFLKFSLVSFDEVAIVFRNLGVLLFVCVEQQFCFFLDLNILHLLGKLWQLLDIPFINLYFGKFNFG